MKKHFNGLVPTKAGDYGNNAVPSPTAYDETVYTATTVSFDGDNGKLVDSACAFADHHIIGGSTLVITTTSGTNDGTYTVSARGVSRSEVLIDEALTNETSSSAGTVTIKRRIYKPNVTTGCPFCGSLNSKGA